MGVLCLKWDMLTLKSLLLPVTCYRRGRNAAVPPFCLRCAFVLPSLQVRSNRWSINGLTTDLQRTCIGGSWEFSQNLIEVGINFWGWFRNGFHVFHRFSSLLNKVKQPEINAYCYAIETIGCPYLAPLILHNILIFFILCRCKQDLSLAQQASEIPPSNE